VYSSDDLKLVRVFLSTKYRTPLSLSLSLSLFTRSCRIWCRRSRIWQRHSDRYCSSALTSLCLRGDGLQSTMLACSPRRASAAGSGSVFKIRMGAYCTCLIGCDKEGRLESKESRKA